MRTHMPKILSSLAIGSALFLTGCGGSSEASDEGGSDDVIRYATLPLSDDPSADVPVEEIAELLEGYTGMEVVVTEVPNYSAVIEAVRAGHEDIGLMSGFPSALAINTGEVDSLVAWPGTDEPASTCIVMDDSPLESLDDITPETTVAFADAASSSGFFMPTHMLHEAGLAAGEDFEELFSGGHDRSFMALKEGQADVACTAPLFTEMAGEDNPMFPFDDGETRSIGESISMPVSMSALTNPDMSDSKREALLEAIPQLFSEENRDALGIYMESMPEGVEPIVEPETELFQPFVDIASVAEVDISDLG
ncbi:MAG: PhnD/SsuA/transferrin family substrate-binding protein [Yaniella sp.]|uniref:phosphate/phosphite/phosphonate ABC transporter substrate-binding protein n=1 Tax=Yaniella sp. TaxID=2773929 RepID=UPI003F96C18F